MSPHTSVLRCPACVSLNIDRSHARSRYERLRKAMAGARGARLYRRCNCGWRGWMEPRESTSGLLAADARAVNLRSLDTSRRPHPSRSGFSKTLL
jgi:hypothetical protein